MSWCFELVDGVSSSVVPERMQERTENIDIANPHYSGTRITQWNIVFEERRRYVRVDSPQSPRPWGRWTIHAHLPTPTRSAAIQSLTEHTHKSYSGMLLLVSYVTQTLVVFTRLTRSWSTRHVIHGNPAIWLDGWEVTRDVTRSGNKTARRARALTQTAKWNWQSLSSATGAGFGRITHTRKRFPTGRKKK